jgi:hypothetical protein
MLCLPLCIQAERITLAQDLLPDALSQVSDLSERRTLESALAARNLLQSDIRLCGVGRLQTPNGAGTLFVVSLEENGRYCNTVAIIRGVPEPEVIQTLQATGGADSLDSLLRDLDSDGVPELVFNRYFGSFSSECLAVVPVVYKCTQTGCSDESRYFPDFFVRELDEVEHRIEALNSVKGADTSCLVIERDKITRQLGRDRLAGLSLARQWAQSSNPDTRQKAALVAGDIDDAAATELLEKLQDDRNQLVADQAKKGASVTTQAIILLTLNGSHGFTIKADQRTPFAAPRGPRTHARRAIRPLADAHNRVRSAVRRGGPNEGVSPITPATP